jgi:transposase-like protein
MRGSKRSNARRFTDEERILAYQRILEGVTYVDIAREQGCSLKFLYRQFENADRRVVKGHEVSRTWGT